jgi:hypothetical protein
MSAADTHNRRSRNGVAEPGKGQASYPRGVRSRIVLCKNVVLRKLYEHQTDPMLVAKRDVRGGNTTGAVELASRNREMGNRAIRAE